MMGELSPSFLIILIGITWNTASTTTQHTGDHLRVKRLDFNPFPSRTSRSCLLETFQCNSAPDSVCDPGERCVGVDTIPLPSIKCEFDCEPISTPNVTLRTNSTSDVTLDTNTATPNVTIDTNSTTPDTATAGIVITVDPSVCEEDFVCKNGGNCSYLYLKNRGISVGLRPHCDCPWDFQGEDCGTPCLLECYNNGTCYNKTGDAKCMCLYGYAQPDCQERTVSAFLTHPHESEIWYIPVIVCISIVLLLVMLYIILLKLRGRSLFVTKIFHFLQSYEDDDGKFYDAFISFRSSKKDFSQSDDEQFVLKVLQPKLEEEFQYKVCVHYRDFEPGETIANNIMKAVENSRRTILVLSPLYIESEWARLEYQKAQQEMLQLRHKIIPIIYEDISDTRIEDPTLKHILSSVTYIVYPPPSQEKACNRFWEMLKLALPKKKPKDPESLATRTSTTSPSVNSVPNHSKQNGKQNHHATEGLNGHVAEISPTVRLKDLDDIQIEEQNGQVVKGDAQDEICSTNL